jgi:hypothetical protein
MSRRGKVRPGFIGDHGTPRCQHLVATSLLEKSQRRNRKSTAGWRNVDEDLACASCWSVRVSAAVTGHGPALGSAALGDPGGLCRNCNHC